MSAGGGNDGSRESSTCSSPASRCSGTRCGDGDERYGGICDKDGYDFNSWRTGDQTFLGPGLTVDTRQKFTVVTQFLTNNNQTSGTLSEIRRLYVQNGRVIANSQTNIPGMNQFDSITDAFCNAQKIAFGDTNTFESLGGLAQMGNAFAQDMALVMSVWDDHEANMLWLDSGYPTDVPATNPGVSLKMFSASPTLQIACPRRGYVANLSICAASTENMNIPCLDIEPPVRARREDLQPAQTIVKE